MKGSPPAHGVGQAGTYVGVYSGTETMFDLMSIVVGLAATSTSHPTLLATCFSQTEVCKQGQTHTPTSPSVSQGHSNHLHGRVAYEWMFMLKKS